MQIRLSRNSFRHQNLIYNVQKLIKRLKTESKYLQKIVLIKSRININNISTNECIEEN
jgi:hypothetical protein